MRFAVDALSWRRTTLIPKAGHDGRIKMTDWNADFDALVQETMAITKSISVEPPIPRTIIEPNPLPAANRNNSERDEIRGRVANFKAHQERLARDREDYAASQIKRMRERL
jgi:hypothetical protein